MATKTISDLTSAIEVKDSDVLLVEDGTTTMKVTKQVLLEECSKEGHIHDIGDIESLHDALDGKLDYVELSTVAISGNYGDLIDTPYIPTKVSDLENDNNYLTIVPSEYITENELAINLSTKSDVSHTHAYSEITDVPNIPTKVSELENDSEFVTKEEYLTLLDRVATLESIVENLQNNSNNE